eukprot:1077777_1
MKSSFSIHITLVYLATPNENRFLRSENGNQNTLNMRKQENKLSKSYNHPPSHGNAKAQFTINAYNDTCKTLVTNHKEGVILRCRDYFHCRGRKIVLPKLTKHDVFGAPKMLFPCQKCDCLISELYERGMICACGHSKDFHSKTSVYPDEWDGTILNSAIAKPLTLIHFAECIRNGNAKKIICLAGAGISTSCGIPDFRSPQNGIYHNLKKYKDLSSPEDIFTLDYFMKNPKPFYMLSKEIFCNSHSYSSSATHFFFKLLSDKGVLLRLFTQNIDGMEHMAGLPGDKMVEAHGTYRTGHCVQCKKVYDEKYYTEKIMNDIIPTCVAETCDGFIKPDITFFGEQLPSRFFECKAMDFKRCDMLIILGTSLSVMPFCELIHKVPANTPRLLINDQHSAKHSLVQKDRDLFFKTNCDDGVKHLCELVGWEKDLHQLMHM